MRSSSVQGPGKITGGKKRESNSQPRRPTVRVARPGGIRVSLRLTLVILALGLRAASLSAPQPAGRGLSCRARLAGRRDDEPSPETATRRRQPSGPTDRGKSTPPPPPFLTHPSLPASS